MLEKDEWKCESKILLYFLVNLFCMYEHFTAKSKLVYFRSFPKILLLLQVVVSLCTHIITNVKRVNENLEEKKWRWT